MCNSQSRRSRKKRLAIYFRPLGARNKEAVLIRPGIILVRGWSYARIEDDHLGDQLHARIFYLALITFAYTLPYKYFCCCFERRRSDLTSPNYLNSNRSHHLAEALARGGIHFLVLRAPSPIRWPPNEVVSNTTHYTSYNSRSCSEAHIKRAHPSGA